MELKKNIQITADEKKAMAEKAIELMVDYTKITSDKNVLTCFDGANVMSPRVHSNFNARLYQACVEVPKDIMECLVGMFILKGYYVFKHEGVYIVTKRDICPLSDNVAKC